ncbi:MAG: hypothetical protein A3F09_04690 [Chlamydiae bacterium RIFCSPHIGHO2_12_FULL_49_11]|nr:MAG: hypothetical protein A3F09_04690 [Chlamydiae bacterium RIFCSPHIGHO2_12_FULL_49_11]
MYQLYNVRVISSVLWTFSMLLKKFPYLGERKTRWSIIGTSRISSFVHLVFLCLQGKFASEYGSSIYLNLSVVEFFQVQKRMWKTGPFYRKHFCTYM